MMRSVKTPAPALVALLVSLSAVGCRAKPDECRLPTIECGGKCVDGGSDPANCGGCGVACGAGRSCCGGACSDLMTDGANCGRCGQDCGVGACSGGTCDPCTSGTHCAGDPWPWCRDLSVDPLNCNTCGNACTALANEACSGGACGCFDPAHPTTCDAQAACANLAIDPENCGTCGVACTQPAKTRCSSGSCACTSESLTDCPGQGCFDLQTDEQHCGDCGHACAAGATCCTGTCTDLRADPSSCGTCGHACPIGQACASSACACSDGTKKTCGANCCAGTACCSSGTACQTEHTNGVGGSRGGLFYDCNPLYVPGSATTKAAAIAAADAWELGVQDYDGIVCDPSCFGRRTGTNKFAVWCYGSSPFAGHATAFPTVTLSCPDNTGVQNWK